MKNFDHVIRNPDVRQRLRREKMQKYLSMTVRMFAIFFPNGRPLTHIALLKCCQNICEHRRPPMLPKNSLTATKTVSLDIGNQHVNETCYVVHKNVTSSSRNPSTKLLGIIEFQGKSSRQCSCLNSVSHQTPKLCRKQLIIYKTVLFPYCIFVDCHKKKYCTPLFFIGFRLIRQQWQNLSDVDFIKATCSKTLECIMHHDDLFGSYLFGSSRKIP